MRTDRLAACAAGSKPVAQPGRYYYRGRGRQWTTAIRVDVVKESNTGDSDKIGGAAKEIIPRAAQWTAGTPIPRILEILQSR